ncbi:murein biosynthesis integral membrane protein MurJ, partial [Patescibacteria group bacterium]
SMFGAGDELDAYFAAFRIPDFLLNLLILGAFSAAFIPVFTDLISRKKKKHAFLVANSVLNLILMVMLALSVIVLVFAPQLMYLITPGFSPEKLDVTANLTRIMLLSPLLFGISTVIGGILNSYRKFFSYAIAPVMYNLGIILGTLIFVPHFGVYGLAMGVGIGALLHVLIQVPATLGTGFRYRPKLKIKDYFLIKIGKLMLPRAAGLAVTQINLIVITVIASTLMAGSVAIFNFANDLQNLPVSLFGISFAIAVFPTLARNASLKQFKKFNHNFSHTFRQITFLIVPAAVGLFLLRAQIVRLVLGSGKFDWEDTYYTAATLGLFCIGLIGQALIPLVARAFYALQDTKTPVFISISSVILNIGLSLLFVRMMGVVGLALAFSISSLINAALLYWMLHRRIRWIDDRAILITFLKSLASSVVMGLVIYGALYLVAEIVNMQMGWGILVQTCAAALAGFGAYMIIAWVWGCEEISAVKKFLKKLAGIKI